MAQKLTVLIPCKNESSNIGACIESARQVADEILVADSLSTDDTLAIVRRAGGCRIIEREFVDHADFKNWAIPQASHPWVLVVDADERVTAELAAEIRETLGGDDPSLDAYRMRRENYFLGYPIRHCGWNSPTITRLFRRDTCRYGTAKVHESMEVDPERVGTLRGRLIHYTSTSLGQWTEKQNRYSDVMAEEKHAAHHWTNGLGVIGIPLVRFIHLYIIRGGFLDGTPGLIVCLSSAYYTFLKHAKLWHLNHPGRCVSDTSREGVPGPHAPQGSKPDGTFHVAGVARDSA
jgi:(heptosyl)LPS beta-1,4-glucosyltransferase